MINANELRCGNLVMTNNSKYRSEDVGKIACITQIDSDRYFEEIKGNVSLYLIDDKYKDTYGQWLIYIEPIPITEQWILNFGFTESETDLRKGNIIVRFRDNESLIITIIDSVVLPKCQYIHELQNLYFALHRQELELIKSETTI